MSHVVIPHSSSKDAGFPAEHIMRFTVVAVCALTCLVSVAQAVPVPTLERAKHHVSESAAPLHPKYDDLHAWLGNAVDPVSPDPIPTPAADAFDDSFMDLLDLQPGGGPVKTDRTFAWCANEGEGNPSCFCNGAMRYGSYGTDESRAASPDVAKWAYRRSCGNVDCASKDFGNTDPFPGDPKICQCTAPLPTPTPSPNALKWKFCGTEGKTCECGANSVVRFGSTGSKDVYFGGSQPTFFADHPKVTKFKYHETPLHAGESYVCANASFPGEHPWPEGLREKDAVMICQCAPLPDKSEEWCEASPTPKSTFDALKAAAKTNGAKANANTDTAFAPKPIIGADGLAVPDEAPRPWEVKWTWCGSEGDACNCLGVARYGHSGEFEMYQDNSKFFRENPDVFKWVNKQTDGAITCDSETFGGLDPFPNHAKMCQCASGVGIDVFTPFSVSSTEIEDADPVASIPVTPQVVLSLNSNAASLGAKSVVAPSHAFHHNMQPSDHHFEARDLAGFSKEQLDLLHRSDEVAAMKAATRTIAAREGALPQLPEETRGSGNGGPAVSKQSARVSLVGKFANLGAAAPTGRGGVYFLGVGAVASAVALGVVAVSRKRNDRYSPLPRSEETALHRKRYDVYL